MGVVWYKALTLVMSSMSNFNSSFWLLSSSARPTLNIISIPSMRNMSIIRNEAQRGRVDAKRVRNQELEYIEVWKPCGKEISVHHLVCMHHNFGLTTGIANGDNPVIISLIINDSPMLWNEYQVLGTVPKKLKIITFKSFSLLLLLLVPQLDSLAGKTGLTGQPLSAYTAPWVCSDSSYAQKHKKLPPLASRKKEEILQKKEEKRK